MVPNIVVVQPEDFSGDFPVGTILTLECNSSTPDWNMTDCFDDCFPIINTSNAKVSTTDRTEDNAKALTYADEGNYVCGGSNLNVTVSGIHAI